MSDQSSTNQLPEAGVVAGLLKIAMVLRHEAWQDAGGRGLTPTQAQILTLLRSRKGENQGVRQIADHLAVAMGTASDAVSALERKGLITKKPSPSDGRSVVVRLTQRGRRLADRSMEWPEVMLDAIEELSPEEQAVFKRGLVKIIHALQEQGKIPLARMCASCRFFQPNEHPGSSRPHHCAYMDAPIGDVELRLDCQEMEPARGPLGPRLWQAFVNGHAV